MWMSLQTFRASLIPSLIALVHKSNPMSLRCSPSELRKSSSTFSNFGCQTTMPPLCDTNVPMALLSFQLPGGTRGQIVTSQVYHYNLRGLIQADVGLQLRKYLAPPQTVNAQPADFYFNPRERQLQSIQMVIRSDITPIDIGVANYPHRARRGTCIWQTWLHTNGSFPSGHKLCTACKHTSKTESFSSISSGKKYSINQFLNCNTKYAVYLITCTDCSLHY